MIPSRRLVFLMIGPLGLALLTLVDEGLLRAMIAADIGVVAIAALDALFGRRPLIQVRRTVGRVLSVGRMNLVTLEVRSRARRTLDVAINDDVFDDSSTRDLPVRVALRPRSQATVQYHVSPTRRGAYEIGDHTVRYPTPLGLWTRQLRIGAHDAVHVYPDVQMVRAYELLARQDREQALVRATRRPGGESEFERLREYRVEDEFRSIDWKATARRQTLIARQYQLERNQNIMFMLDAGRLMTAETQGLPLFDHALNATLLLAHAATRAGDHVGLLTFSDRVLKFIPPTGGRGASRKLVQACYDIHPGLVESSYDDAFGRLAARMRRRTLVVLFTQVVDEVSASELVRLASGLLPRHLPLVVMLRDPELEALALVDQYDDAGLYAQAAAAEVLGWRDRIVRKLRRMGANVLDVEPRDLTPALLNRYLEIKVRHLL